MKILVDARPIVDPARGGVSRVSVEIVAAYAETFPEDTLFCVTTGTRKPLLPSRLVSRANVTQCHLPIPNKLWSALCIFGIVSLTRSVERKIGNSDATFFPNIGFVGNRGRDKSRPYTLLLHDLSFLIEPHWFSWKQRLWHHAIRAKKQIRNATHLLAVSETTKKDALRLLGIAEERITVIPIGPTLSSAPSATAYRLQPLPSTYVLALGGNDPRKNSATAIEAVHRLREEEKYKDVELVIVGAPLAPVLTKGRVGALVGMSIRAGTRPAPTDTELASLYTNAAVFLYPSWYEGFGLPLHEAAHFGTPCIASTSGALPETAPLGTLFANPAKPHQWVEALRIALDAPRPSPTAVKQTWKEAAERLRASLTKEH